MNMRILLTLIAVMIVIPCGSSATEPEQETLIFAFDPWPPYHEMVNGKSEGLLIEIVRELFVKRLHYNVKYHQRPWARAQAEVQMGVADFMITVPIDERLTYSYPSDIPVFILKNCIYTATNHPRLSEINDIKSHDELKRAQLTGVSILGYKWFETHVAPYLSRSYYAKDDSAALHMLARQRADIIVAGEVPTDIHIRKLNLESKILKTKVVFDQVDMHILFSKKNATPDILHQMNTTLSDMKQDGTLEKIMNSF